MRSCNDFVKYDWGWDVVMIVCVKYDWGWDVVMIVLNLTEDEML